MGLALGATPAFAANVSGWYAGIYGGPAQRNHSGIDLSLISGAFDGPGTIRTPSVIVNDNLDPRLFDALNDALAEYPFADYGVGGGLIASGTMDFDRARLIGGVIGYGLGNGVRIEVDYASAQFDAATLTVKDSFIGGAEGGMNPDGSWVWTNPDGTVPGGSLDAMPVEVITGASTFYTRAEFLLLNGWYDIDTGTAFTPYLGGGAGLARISTLASTTCTCDGKPLVLGKDTAYVPAAQLGGGVRIKLAEPVSLDFGYRLKMASSPDAGFTDIDDSFFPLFTAMGINQRGLVVVNSITAGLTFALN